MASKKNKTAGSGKLWGGRFDGATDPTVERFSASVHFDRALAQYDIRGSIAHARMLAETGLIPHADADALVAGLDAGLAYNTWPLMDGALVPGGLWLQDPWWINAFENPKTVQFIHRFGAYAVLAAAIVHMLRTMKRDAGSTHARRSALLAGLVVVQAVFGIVTLLMQVPLFWGLVHQGTALVVLGFAVAHWRGTIGSYRPETDVVVRH